MWKLIAPENYTVQMAFIDLEIEADSDCVYDFVSVLYLNSEGQVIRYVSLSSQEAVTILYVGHTNSTTLCKI